MLDSRSRKLLRLMDKRNESNWITPGEIAGLFPYALDCIDLPLSLKEAKYIGEVIEGGEGGIEKIIGYRIFPEGRAYLEANRRECIDRWITRAIAIAGFILSIISIVLQYLPKQSPPVP